MENNYSSACRKMIEHYSKFLTDKEILALNKIIKLDKYDNLNIIIFINKLIDRIWQMTLTKPTNYKSGEPFTFLTTRDLLPNEYNLSGMKDFEKHKSFFLELISDETIINSFDGINGMIVEIDYANTFSEPILPIDLITKKRILSKTKLDVLGIYNISLGLGKYDAEDELTTAFSEITHIPKIDINKTIYNYLKNKTVLDKNDKDSLANIMIVYYLIENNYDKKEEIIKLRDSLKKKYKNIISKKYIECFLTKQDLNTFVNYVFNILEEDPELRIVDKIV